MRSAFNAQERILPFGMHHCVVPNPARDAWRAASPEAPDLAAELDVFYHLKSDAKGVVYVFHGGSGFARMWITGEEEAALIAELVFGGYSVVLLESTHRPVDSNWFFPDPERFDPADLGLEFADAWNATVNADELLVRNVHARLGFERAAHVCLAGFSSGAKFACAMAYSLQLDAPHIGEYYYESPRAGDAQGLTICAAAFYNDVCVPYYFGNYSGDPSLPPKERAYSTPSIFNYSEFDEKNPVAEVESSANVLGALGVAYATHVSRPVPLSSDRFARVLGVSFTESRALAAQLSAEGYIDANGYVLDRAQQAECLRCLPPDKRDGVQEQLTVLRAEHHVSAEFHHQTLAFFDQHLDASEVNHAKR